MGFKKKLEALETYFENLSPNTKWTEEKQAEAIDKLCQYKDLRGYQRWPEDDS